MPTWKKVLTEADIATSDSLGTSDTVVPSQGAVKSYVDGAVEADTVRTVTAGGNTLAASETLAFTAGGNVTITESGGAVTIAASDTNTQLSTEQVQDIVGAMFSGNTETRISATYQDADGTIDLVVDDMTANNDVNIGNLTARLPQITESFTIGDATDVTVTTSGDLTVTGDLTVSGDTTTLNTATLTVEDKMITAGAVSSPSVGNATASGIDIGTSSTINNRPRFMWYKDKGGGHTDGTGTANGLTGWTLSNHRTSNQLQTPIAIMQFNGSAPTNETSQGIGSFWFESTNGVLYVRTA